MSKTMVAYGAGTNSTAMIILCAKLGIQIDFILFADTGAEKPHTYNYVKLFSEWCVKNGLPAIITIKKGDETLEQECLRHKSLPSIVYGRKSCSDKYKIQPIDKFLRLNTDTKELVTKLIGFDSNEINRIEKSKLYLSKKFIVRFPLQEYGFTRKDCIKIIIDSGLCLPGKSSCYFCPSSKKSEILALKENYHELLERAIALEENANLRNIQGLGHDFSWRNVSLIDDMFADRFSLQPEMICECYDT
jgi:hypothetical protein